MLAGVPPYTGSSHQAVLGKILRDPPAVITGERKSVPPNVDAAIRKSLEKLPADRFRSAAAFAAALSDPGFRHGGEEPRGVLGAPGRRLVAALAGIAIVSTTALAVTLLRPDAEGSGATAGVIRLPIELGDPRDQAVFERRRRRRSALPPPLTASLRRWDAERPAPIPETELAYQIDVSPGGDSVVFARWQNELMVSSLAGGAQRLASDVYCCVRWEPDGFIYYTAAGGALQRVRASGGDPVFVDVDRDIFDFSLDYSGPADGDGVGVFTRIRDGRARIVAVRDDGTRAEVTDGLSPILTPTGHLVFASQGGALLAAAFDH